MKWQIQTGKYNLNRIRKQAEHRHRGNTMQAFENNEITLTKMENVTLFDIEGDMTAFSEESFNVAYQQASGQETQKILFNFKPDTYINSAGIAIFIQIIAQTIKRNQLIGITGLSKHFVKIFNLLGITRFAKIHDTIKIAVLALNAQT